MDRVTDSHSFAPMGFADLDWVVAQEATLHAFPWTRGNFVDSLNAGYLHRLMFEAGVPIAYAVVLGVIDEAHLLNLSVVRSAWGRGCGQRMLEHLIEEARQGAIRQYFLEVRPSNTAAIALYQRLGFAEIGRRKRYYPAPEGREDAIVMRREL
ncbi:ribosomal-protein-alanine acetyltransferase [Betaproteobacteria bacterium]|nr:ribosomal-protein-alanine acetyltransferase [Betaproteobacteria bacterium]GHT98908.1 ribosomal-protein-alanine acetyltransferase [Betaproteobacteria bacterium]GHU21551.1 ribosomal-protein-alanine acetyltransferase [Betaproteobacteria bacterium]GHU27716.1 ribosomal-protein-alanine acetyltransferase [Betaproteobacteria bacterium]